VAIADTGDWRHRVYITGIQVEGTTGVRLCEEVEIGNGKVRYFF